jgi:hypothetical protein
MFSVRWEVHFYICRSASGFKALCSNILCLQGSGAAGRTGQGAQ